MNKFIIFIGVFILTIILLIVGLAISINFGFFQNKLIDIASNEISKKFNTEVKIDNVSIDWLSKIDLNGILVRDINKDTAIAIKKIHTNYSIIDFWKLNFENKNIDIEGVKLFLSNTKDDSTLNITKTFRLNNSKKIDTLSKNNKNKKNSNRKISINNLNIKDFLLIGDFKYRSEKIILKTDQLEIKANNTNVFDSILKLKSLSVSKPYFSLKVYKNNIPKKDKSKPEYLKIPINIRLENLKINNAKFNLSDENYNQIQNYGKINFNNLSISNINIDSKGIIVEKNGFFADINKFTAKTNTGFEIQELKSKMYFSSDRMIAPNLFFKTKNSLLNGFLKFDYKHMMNYLKFAKTVNVFADMRNSYFSMKDLTFFISDLDKLDQNTFYFTSKFKGTMNALNISNLSCKSSSGFYTNSNLFVKDLFESPNLRIFANIKTLEGNKKNIENFFKGLSLPSKINNLGKIVYTGNFKGNFKNFLLNGKFTTNIGSSHVKNLNLNFQNKIPLYNGNISLLRFNLSKLLEIDKEISNINCSLNINGSGINFNTLNSSVKGNIENIYFNKYNYKNTLVNGVVINKLFKGQIDFKDENFNISSKGDILFSKENPEFMVDVDFKNLNLKKINFLNKEIVINSTLKTKFIGKNIDDFIGNVNIENIKIMDLSSSLPKEYLLSNLNIYSHKDNNLNRTISIYSNEIKLDIKGKYNISDMPSFLKKYLINYFNFQQNEQVSTEFENSNFVMDLELLNIKNYSSLFIKNLNDIGQGKIKASFEGNRNLLNIDVNLKNIIYSNVRIPNIYLNSNSSFNNFDLKGGFDSLFVNQKLAISPLNASIQDIENGLKLNVEIMNKDSLNFVEFNSSLTKIDDLYNFKVLPFSKISKSNWQVNEDNLLTFNNINKNINISNLNFSKDDQQIKISSLLQENKKVIDCDLENLKINQLISGFLPNLDFIHGDLNGNVKIYDILENPKPLINIQVNNTKVNNYNVGKVYINSDIEKNKINSSMLIEGQNNYIKINSILIPSENEDSISSEIDIVRLNPIFINSLLKELVYDMSGNIRGRLLLNGTFSDPKLNGNLTIDTLHTGLHNLYTTYSLKNQRIFVSPTAFNIYNFEFYDSFGNKAIANGKVINNKFRKFDLDLIASSEKLLCLNSNSSNNSSFHGKVFANFESEFTGTIGKIINIKAKGTNLEESKLNIVFSNSEQFSKYNFYKFKNKKIELESKRKKESGVNLDFDFDVNTDGKAIIVFDPLSDDKLEVNGDGRISFKMNTNKEMDLKGSYEIKSGHYLFTFKNFIQRTFYLNPGGIIQFTGNPLNTNINASAIFKARASAQDLVKSFYGTNTNQDLQFAEKSTLKVNLTLFIKEKLNQPKISYDINIDQNNSVIQAAFEPIKNSIINNENEMNRQVFGLLTLERFFAPSSTGFEKTGIVASDISNTAYDFLTDKISSSVTDLLTYMFPGINFDLKYRNYSQKNDDISENRQEILMNFSKTFFNDRLILNAGANYDFSSKTSSSSINSFFGGDIDFEYLLNKKGNFRFKGFATFENDPINSKTYNKLGGGLLINREFDNFQNIFDKKKLDLYKK